MAQAIVETVFDAVYLCTVITLGILMLRGAKGNRQITLFGAMAVILGCGDAFHLVPRAFALCTTGLESHAAALGVGKLITSITMTVFYVILYHIWRKRYQIQGRTGLTAAIYLLSAVRIAICAFPQNDWLSYHQPLLWGILRNIPFAIMGLIIIVIFYQEASRHNDGAFRWMWLAIVLSFGFYIPVVLFGDAVPLVGMLMIPKTLAYVWVVWMGFSEFRKGRTLK